jgi:4-amino-4-deoxy-L-arabinose transferase-like glycosyltransferase
MTDSKSQEKAQETPAPLAAPAYPAWASRLARRPFVLLTLLGLLLWLPGVLSLPALDRDESRFAQSSRQMVESGDVVDIRFGQVPRYKKPIGIYWLQATATRLASPFLQGRDDRIWTYRLPSLLGGIAAAWLTVWCALAVAEAEVALLAGLLMLGSVLLTAEATIATTDAVLLACMLGVQGVLLRLYRAARQSDGPRISNRTVMWGWAAFGFGILVKGPVIFGALLTILGLVGWDWWEQRRTSRAAAEPIPDAAADAVAKTKTEAAPDVATDAAAVTDAEIDAEPVAVWAWLAGLRPWRGLSLVLLLIVPWLIAITIQSRGAFLEQSLGEDFAAKMAGGQESHGGWPGYYLLLSAISFWPAILFVLPGIVSGVTLRAEPGTRFLLVWAASWWLAVELVPTKLPHYVILAYPPLAILAALFVLDPRPARFLTPARWIAIVQFVLGAVFITAAIVLLPRYFGQAPDWPVLAAAAVGASLALAALVLTILRKTLPAALLGSAALLVFVPALTVGVGPRLDRLWISERLKPMVEAAGKPGDGPPSLAGYQEPSLVFALGKDVVLADGKGAAESSVKMGGLALIEDDAQGDFLARLAELQADAMAVGDLSGINYSRGRKVHVTLYRVAQLRELN